MIKEIKEFSGYSIDIGGNVYGKRINKLTANLDKRGYHRVWLYDGHSRRKEMLVHRLVAMYFVDGDKSLTVNHKDNNKNNNHASNLEWASNGDNLRHSFNLGFRKKENLGKKKGRFYAGDNVVLKKALIEYKYTKISFRKLEKKYGINRATLQYQNKHNFITI